MKTLTRGGTLAQAGERMGLDASTVFRTLQRIEKGLGQRLLERSRTGYQAPELAQELAQMRPEQVAGSSLNNDGVGPLLKKKLKTLESFCFLPASR